MFFIFIFFIPVIVIAQQDTSKYFDQYWNETGRDSAHFFRLTEEEGRFYKVRDYYISGQMQMEGRYISLNPEVQEGYFIWYYENGQKFAEGNYISGLREGIWTFWFPDGLKKEEIKFHQNRQSFFEIKWQSKRVINTKRLLEKAERLKERGKINRALELLNETILINPYSADAFFQRGLILCSTGKLSDGCIDFHQSKQYGFYDMTLLNETIDFYCRE